MRAGSTKPAGRASLYQELPPVRPDFAAISSQSGGRTDGANCITAIGVPASRKNSTTSSSRPAVSGSSNPSPSTLLQYRDLSFTIDSATPPPIRRADSPSACTTDSGAECS
ncbi:hypothetical protein [Kribbella sp. NPDC051770]|uniref:hypothetical protein n=1 Tax=Kribbella sp. NPDC051770 TaxID=3155413 RepID=UPI003437EBC7